MRKDCVTIILPSSYRLSWFVTQRLSLFCNAHKNGRLVSQGSNVFRFQCSFFLSASSIINSLFLLLVLPYYNFENRLALLQYYPCYLYCSLLLRLTDGNLAEVCRLSPQRRSPVLSRKNRESKDPCFVARLLVLLIHSAVVKSV